MGSDSTCPGAFNFDCLERLVASDCDCDCDCDTRIPLRPCESPIPTHRAIEIHAYATRLVNGHMSGPECSSVIETTLRYIALAVDVRVWLHILRYCNVVLCHNHASFGLLKD